MKKLSAIVALAGVLVLFGGVDAMATPEPSFQSLAKEGALEIRRYPEMAAAEIVVPGPRERAANTAFNALFRYISGANVERKKIEMTAPVTEARTGRKGQKIEMTAPVTETPTEDGWVVRFILPERFTAATAPAPIDPAVRIVSIAPQEMAAIRFSGVARDRDLEARTVDLQAFIAAKGRRAAGVPVYAFYNAPFVPGFLRRNEVLIPLE